MLKLINDLATFHYLWVTPPNPPLPKRNIFIIKPELTIAKLISDELFEQLEDWWIEEIEQRQNIDFETDWEFLAYKQIYKLLSPLSTNTLLSPNTPLSLDIEFKLFEDVVKPVGLEIYYKSIYY